MKKLTLIVSAIALLIGFSQCKKEVINPNTNDQGVHITLNAGYGQNGQRTDFNPAGSFVWTNGATEYVYVGGANHSGCMGVLSGTGNGTATMTFTGELTDTPAEGETLHFFYLGKGRDGSAVNTLDFSNQNGTDVTNCHIAIGSVEVEYTGQTSFTATLNMAMAIAYFNLNQFKNSSDVAETVYIHGDEVYATATIDYNNGVITGDTKGFINVGTANTGKYVALIPSVTTSTTVKFESNTKTGSMTFLRGIKPASYYSANGSALTVTAETGTGIPGTFSVSATKKVFFSKGNLQYQASTGTWRFAENQYDAIGNDAGNNNFTDTRSTQSEWIDLFGWGTSGWEGGSVTSSNYYRPYDYVGTGSSGYGYCYGPSTGSKYTPTCTYSLVGDYANRDWGVYNTISNGGSGWRTLTGSSNDAEWYYLLFTRDASTVAGTENARYFLATVNEIWGLVILPDVYSHPTGVKNPSNINTSATTYTITAYTIDEWNAIESAGAVFLPRVGYRSYSSNNPSYTEDNGYYWSTSYNSNDKAYAMYISTYCSVSAVEKRRGCFVRLVKDVE